MMKYVITFDIGTTGVKTCVFGISDKINLLGSASQGYGLYVFPDGGAEQDTEEWWEALCETCKKAVADSGVSPEQIEGISFCSQMQGLVLVDKNGNAVRRPMSYMDQRAREELKKGIAHGITVAGASVPILIKSLVITGAVAASVKDPVWKYNWVKNHEPENFKKVYKWLDVKEYLICRMTGEFVMTKDSAFGTLLYDLRKGHETWSESLCKTLGVDVNHMPKLIKSTDIVGSLREEQAAQLGLKPGIAVYGGGGDASLIGVGAGAVNTGDTHIYCGTSGWCSTVVEKSVVDASAMIAAVIGADDGKFNYFGELETAGKCLEWVKDHLALDEINIYLKKENVADSYESEYTSLYDYMSDVINSVPAGARGVIFTPWLHGNRCPFEDPNARGMFFNISLETGKSDLLRAVIEGVCYHLRWFMEAEDKKVKSSETIRFVGGGALSYVTCQVLADVLGKKIETVDSPQNVGAVGAAVTIAVGSGVIKSFSEAKKLIPVTNTYIPNAANKEIYDKQYAVFKKLYKSNKENFAALNG
ncbi:MAG: FGGY-family carbohydrate kinase [Oscillospiraceae bacterium]|nr:FGGY-family carbohydrate kinase [Oscillospiraceae bacterium]